MSQPLEQRLHTIVCLCAGVNLSTWTRQRVCVCAHAWASLVILAYFWGHISKPNTIWIGVIFPGEGVLVGVGRCNSWGRLSFVQSHLSQCDFFLTRLRLLTWWHFVTNPFRPSQMLKSPSGVDRWCSRPSLTDRATEKNFFLPSGANVQRAVAWNCSFTLDKCKLKIFTFNWV